MADRALRRDGLSFYSKTSKGIEFAERQSWRSTCPKDHHFTVTFALEAATPTEWECKEVWIDRADVF